VFTLDPVLTMAASLKIMPTLCEGLRSPAVAYWLDLFAPRLGLPADALRPPTSEDRCTVIETIETRAFWWVQPSGFPSPVTSDDAILFLNQWEAFHWRYLTISNMMLNSVTQNSRRNFPEVQSQTSNYWYTTIIAFLLTKLLFYTAVAIKQFS
jgi:hypothetical protein